MVNIFPADLPSEYKNRIDLIRQTIPQFWEQKRYNHFTNQGVRHSERVANLLYGLLRELPPSNQLNHAEYFILMASAYLYEIGMQSPNLKPILDFDIKPGCTASQSQLKVIRDKKHVLSQKLILESISSEYTGIPVPLGLNIPADQYSILTADVCRWCSHESLDQVSEEGLVDGILVRIRLLVTLLRLADQLYIDSPRVNFENLSGSNLTQRELARWWAYKYTSVLPIQNGVINFQYTLPSSQEGILGHLRAMIESDFEYDNNIYIQHLSYNYHLRLLPPRKPTIRFTDINASPLSIDDKIITFITHNIKPYISDTGTPLIKGGEITAADFETRTHNPHQQEKIRKPRKKESNTIEGVDRPLRVFLCHSSDDKPKVRKLYARLNSEKNIESWMDEKNLLPGEEYDTKIRDAVKRADIFIVCLSSSSINKEGYLQKEIKYALDIADEKPEGTIFIIPLKLDPCAIPARLSKWHWLNYYEKGAFKKLTESLQAQAETLGIHLLL